MTDYERELVHEYKKEIFLNILILMLVSFLSLAGPVFLRKGLVDEYGNILIKAVFAYFGILFCLFIMKFLQNRYKFWFGEIFKIKESQKLYNEFFHMEYDSIIKLEPTYISERIGNTVDIIFSLYSNSLSGICVSITILSITLLFIFRISKLLFLLYFIQIPLQYIGFKKLLNGEHSKLSLLSKQLQEKKATCSKNIKAIVSNVENIKQLFHKIGIQKLIHANLKDVYLAEHIGNRYAMDVCTILDLFSTCLKNSSYIIIVILFGRGIVTFGDLTFLVLINDIFYGSINDVLNIQINMRDLHGAFLFVKKDIRSNFEGNGDIVLSQVNEIKIHEKDVGYENKSLVKNVEFSLFPGDFVFFSGDSGQGKSTIAKMIPKLHKSSDVFINGNNINDISNENVHDKILYMSQKTTLFPMTILDNITLGEKITEESWNNLLAQPFMKKIVSLGLDTVIQENSSNISGGDAQKIVLARILLLNPDVLILDESFNSIDLSTSKEIIEYIKNSFMDKIVILISHTDDYRIYCNKTIKIDGNNSLFVVNESV